MMMQLVKRRFRLHASLHVSVCNFDQLPKRRGIGVTFGPEFNMAHELASTFQDTMRISDLSAPEESDINVSFEHIDVAESGIIDARSRMTIMQYLSNIFSAGAHDLKPALCDCAQFTGMFVHPDLDPWISLN